MTGSTPPSGDVQTARRRVGGIGASNRQRFVTNKLNVGDSLLEVRRPQDATRRHVAHFRHLPKPALSKPKNTRNVPEEGSRNQRSPQIQTLDTGIQGVAAKSSDELSGTRLAPDSPTRVQSPASVGSLPPASPATRGVSGLPSPEQVEPRVSRSAHGSRTQKSPLADLPSRPHTVQGKRGTTLDAKERIPPPGKIKKLMRLVQNRMEKKTISMKKQWLAWDAKRLGYVDVADAKTIIKDMHLGFDDAVVDKMLDEVNSRKDGKIKFDDFQAAFRPRCFLSDEFDPFEEVSFKVGIDANLPADVESAPPAKWALSPAEVNHALTGEIKLRDWMINRHGSLVNGFRFLDTNKDGAIDTEELRATLKAEQTRLGFKDEEVDALVRWCDGDGKGRMEYETFANSFDRESACQNGYFTRPKYVNTHTFTPPKEPLRPTKEMTRPATSPVASSNMYYEGPRFSLATGRPTFGGKRYTFPERPPKRGGYVHSFPKDGYVGAAFTNNAVLSARPMTGDPAHGGTRYVSTAREAQQKVANESKVNFKDGYQNGTFLHQQKVERLQMQRATEAAARDHEYLQRRKQTQLDAINRYKQNNAYIEPEVATPPRQREPSTFLQHKRREMSMVHYQGSACFRRPVFKNAGDAATYNRPPAYVAKRCHVGVCEC